MRGAVSGAFWGLLLGTSGLAVVSLVNDQPVPANTPQMPQITVPQAVVTDPVPGPLLRAAVDTRPASGMDAAQMPPPAAPTARALFDSAPATPPAVINDEPPQPAPAADGQQSDGIIASADDDPVVGGTAMAAPDLASDVIVAPEPPVPAVAQTPVPEQAPETTGPVIAAPAPDTDSTVVAPTIIDAPTIPVVVTQAPVSVADDLVQPAPVESADDTASIEQMTPAPQVVAETSPPTNTLPQVNSGVRINRPGADPAPAAGTPSEIAQEPEDAAQDDAPALLRYAAELDNPDGLPMLGVVLLDDGTMPDAAARLADLPFPVTVILDPLQADVGQAMTAYRDAGAEVGLQIALPFGARAQDVEVAFQAAFAMVPESVVLYSGGADLLQSDRAVTGQMIAVLAAEGLGLVVVERGLNNVVRQADAAEVPAAAVQRDLTGGDAMAASRALDQAAFRARQGQAEGVVVTGPLTPEFLAELADWARATGTGQIALAPASAILLAR